MDGWQIAFGEKRMVAKERTRKAGKAWENNEREKTCVVDRQGGDREETEVQPSYTATSYSLVLTGVVRACMAIRALVCRFFSNPLPPKVLHIQIQMG
jgi:hypothetical protein